MIAANQQELRNQRLKLIAQSPPTFVELTDVFSLDVDEHLNLIRELGIVDRDNLYWMFQRFVISCQLYN